jgi:hypothetical protein
MLNRSRINPKMRTAAESLRQRGKFMGFGDRIPSRVGAGRSCSNSRSADWMSTLCRNRKLASCRCDLARRHAEVLQ